MTRPSWTTPTLSAALGAITAAVMLGLLAGHSNATAAADTPVKRAFGLVSGTCGSAPAIVAYLGIP